MNRGSGTDPAVVLLVAVVVVSSAVPIGIVFAAPDVTQFSVYQAGSAPR